MKRLTAFILISAISLFAELLACGPYYPYGEDIRFVLLKPETFHYPDFKLFSYAASIFYDPEYRLGSSVPDSTDENIDLWWKRCKKIPLLKDVYRAVYLSDDINFPGSPNTFISYLHKTKDIDVIGYLNFAQKCVPLNSILNDPWERNESAILPQRTKLINEALKAANNIKDEDLKSRYAFLAIRLAYYNSDREIIRKIYDQYFLNRKNKNIIDYWSMYFMAFVEPNEVKRNYYTAQVFLHAPDKRFGIFFMYDKKLSVAKTLTFATDAEEKAAVWMMSAFRKPGKCLDILKQIYFLKPNLEGLSFLLLREVNKLEDWIYTPYYTNFSPSLEADPWEVSFYPAQRIQNDRIYARGLLNFIDSADLKKVENPLLWRTAKAYLHYMVQDFETSLNEISTLLKERRATKDLRRQLLVLRSLCATARQENPVLIPEMKPVLMSEFAHGNYKFIFAIARELEYKGNTTDAALLLSKLNEAENNENYYNFRAGIYWYTKKRHHTLYVDYYHDYFFYLDAQYTIQQITDLIANIKTNQNSKDKFTSWKYKVAQKDLPRLYDLLGTKYMRQNNLTAALKSFGKVTDTLWKSEHYPYKTYLNANPFYTNFFTAHVKTSADTISYNKAEITKKLIHYLNKAGTQTKDRDYHYFLVANCYFNMTQYGNSWMMKRYFWTVGMNKTKLEDDYDYFNCSLAKMYYLKAKEASKSKKFAALCLRMAGRCETYKIRFQTGQWDIPLNYYFRKLKREYPAYYDDLMSNCESFENYFSSR